MNLLQRVLLSVIALILLSTENVNAQSVLDDYTRMEGDWAISYLEWGYSVINTKGTLKITEQSFVWGKQKYILWETTALKTAKQFKAIDLRIESGKTLKGIYYLSDKEFWLCVNTQGNRPETFATEPHSLNTWLLKLKKIE